MAFPKVKALSAALALLVSQAASAVGLGEIKLNSALNEPLNAEIELLSVGDLDELELFVNLASRKDFERAGVPRDFFLTGLQFSVDLSGPRPKVLVKSEKPVREPFLDFLVEMQWPSGRLLRNYTVLVDLPIYSDDKAKPKAVESTQSSRPATKPSPQSRPTSPRQSTERNSASAQAGDSDYKVADGDTLWGIARRAKPEGASIHQTMVAIHELNPSAFVRGDINLLKRGEVLRLPQGHDIGVSHSDALADISQQTQSGPLIDATEAPSSQGASQSQPEGRLKLSAASEQQVESDEQTGFSASDLDGAVAGGEGRLSSELTLAQEELARKDRELEEQRDRNAKLEEQVATMQRMLEVGGTSLGETQQALSQNQADTKAAEQQAAQAPAAAGESATETDNAAEQQEQQQAAAPQTQPAESSDMWSKYKYYLMAGVGVLLALLLALGLRRKKEDNDDEFTFEEPAEPALESEPTEPLVATAADEDVAEQAPVADLAQEEGIDLSEEDQLFDFEDDDGQQESEQEEVAEQAEVVDDAESLMDHADSEDSDLQDEDLDELVTRFDEADDEVASKDTESEDDLDFAADLELDDNLLAELEEEDDVEDDKDSSEDSDEALSLDLDEDASDADVADTKEDDVQLESEPELVLDESQGDEDEAVDALSEDSSSEDDSPQESLDDDDFDLDMEGDEIGTKLDLAKAYSDVGDADGAREMLEEVIEEGNDEQKAEAKKLLDDLE
ncbi:hypothetical protein KFE80_02850 [bacterium SCSIO 12696]|nr:hypothetical protein KFE80_02850 [bacterium SCSIO 12696]